jgi:hypothetical protein
MANYLIKFREIITFPDIKSVISNKEGEILHPTSKTADIISKIVKLLSESNFDVNNNTIYTRIRQSKNFKELSGEVSYQKEIPKEKVSKKCDEISDLSLPEIDILITSDQLQDILPVSSRKKDRTRTYPPEGWTNRIQFILTDSLQFPCAFRFVFISAKNVFCSAECKECNKLLHVLISSDSSNRPVIKVKMLRNSNVEVEHVKSRQVRGELRNLDTKDSALNHFNREKLLNVGKNGKSLITFYETEFLFCFLSSEHSIVKCLSQNSF